MNQYEWKYGENAYQKYYDVKLGKDYICVFANKSAPNIWLGTYIKYGCGSVTIANKTFNDKQRKKESKNGTIKLRDNMPNKIQMLSSNDPEYMKKKVIYAYEHNLLEVDC